MAGNYYYDKLTHWMQITNGDYRPYIRNKGKSGISNEFKNDPRFTREVCGYLKTYAKGKERDSVSTIIKGISNPESDVLDILVGATLDACGYTDTGNTLIGLAVAGLIGVGIISILAALTSKR
ncbi:hypothetical protein IX51_03770 [uncultured archaeon]|nr:hypothetical protein IX51_03770 [uncultured archaeon]